MRALLRRLAPIAVAAISAVLVLAAFVAHVSSRGQACMRESDAAFNAGEVRTAAAHARRAATLYLPRAEHVDQAYARLFAIARGAEAAGEPELAREAWQAMRAAAVETRWLWVARRAELAQADANLARLRARVTEAAAELELAAPGPKLSSAPRGPAVEPLPELGATAWPGLFGLLGLSLAFGFSVLRWRRSDGVVA